MYGVVGLVAEELGGSSWEQLIAQRILNPLGMDYTTFIHLEEDRWPDFATGYIEDVDGVLRVQSYEAIRCVLIF